MTWLRSKQHTPIELPDIPRIDRREADIMFHAGYSLTDWMRLTDQERATIRWRNGGKRMSYRPPREGHWTFPDANGYYALSGT